MIEHIIVDAKKDVMVPESLRKSITQWDNNIQELIIDCPRYWYNKKDIYGLAFYVNHLTAKNVKDKETLSTPCTVELDESEDMLRITWPIKRSLSQYDGPFAFLICAKSVDDNGNEITHWNSHLCKDMVIMEGLESNLQDLVEEYPDVITSLLLRVDALEKNGVGPGGGTSFSGSAADVTYDNTNSGLDADNAQEAIDKLSEEIADKATVENGVVKVWKSATEDGGTDTLLYTIDLSSIGSGLDLNNLTLSVSQVGEYQRLFMSDGTTTKTVDIPITAITDEQVQTAVETWLSEHPEATTTVADGSITEAKLADGAVSMNKTSFISFDGYGENLFNKDTATDGYRLELYNATKVVDGYSISDYIPVEANTTYSYINTTLRRVQFFDSAKSFLSGVNASKTFTTVENCAFIRIEFSTTEKDAFMVVEGDTLPSEYVPYVEYYKLNDSVKIGVSNIQELTELFSNIPQNTITTEMFSETVQLEFSGIDSKVKTSSFSNDVRLKRKQLSGRINVFENVAKGKVEITSDISDKTIVVHGVNYFDKDDLVLGTINSSTGEFKDSTTAYRTEHFIPVEANRRLFWNRDNKRETNSYLTFWFYDKDKNYLVNNVVGNATNASGFFVPENACFMIVGCGDLIDASLEKLCIADVDIGSTHYGNYDGNWSLSGNGTYFGKNVYVPYIGYRIENGVLIGASELFTVEEVMHVDVFEADSTIDVSVPIEDFDKDLLQNVQLKFGRYAETDYVVARVFKETIDGKTISPKVLAVTPSGIAMSNYKAENDFVLAINAGIFDMTDNSCLGTTIVDGVVITDHDDSTTCGLSDTLCVDRNGNFTSYPYATTTDTMLTAGITQAVQGWCTIIDNYLPTDITVKTEEVSLPDETNPVLTGKHPRTAVGQYADGDYFVFICGGREANQAGMTCEEVQDVCVAEGVKFAYNLDGGGSCNMVYYKKELAPYTENRADPTYIVFN